MATHISLDVELPWVLLCCFVVCLTLLASFFLPSLSLINMYTHVLEGLAGDGSSWRV